MFTFLSLAWLDGRHLINRQTGDQQDASQIPIKDFRVEGKKKKSQLSTSLRGKLPPYASGSETLLALG